MNSREIEKLANIHAVYLLRGKKKKKQLIKKKNLLVSCLKFTITVKLGKRVKRWKAILIIPLKMQSVFVNINFPEPKGASPTGVSFIHQA